ncbi:hypothetical protein OC861_002797 [Tilletia horrida]|nr:hypothetical protein OC861_002797 [Tilletia horrida]
MSHPANNFDWLQHTKTASGSTIHSHDALIEGAQPAPPKIKRRRRAAIVILIVVGLGTAFGLCLAYGLQRIHRGSTLFLQRSTLPTSGTSLGLDSLRDAGEWFTSPDPDNDNTFVHAESNLTFSNWTNGTKGVDLVIDTSNVHQPIRGFGSAMTDSSAYLLKKLNDSNPQLYKTTMTSLFNPRTGIPILRVPLGSSDFALKEYSYLGSIGNVDTFRDLKASGNLDKILSFLDLDDAKQYLLPVLKDAVAIRPDLNILLTPWSPPAFMKNNSDMMGGSLLNGYEDLLAQYYLRSIKAWQDDGVPIWGMTIQNEPNWAPPYPSCYMSTEQQAGLVKAIRSALKDQKSFGDLAHLVLLGHDDNFDDFADAINLSEAVGDQLDGYGWHCYNGDPSMVTNLTAALARQNQGGKGQYMTECSGTHSSTTNRWASQVWWLEQLYMPALRMDMRAALTWNLALDSAFGPRLDSAICSNCVGPLEITSPDHKLVPGVQAGPQFINMNHLNVASQDLGRIGGGTAHRVSSMWTPSNERGMSDSDMACLDPVTFAAPLKGANLPPPKTGKAANGADKTKRMGLVLLNQCDHSIKLAFSVDGIRTSYQARPGLTTLVWMA